MPIRSLKNQYRGINPHLHSFWQAEHKWHRFHNVYATALMQSLNIALYPMGYIAEIEDSLQICRLGEGLPRQPQAVAELIKTDENFEHQYSAIVISNRSDGFPVTWMEVLSPTNKGTTDDAITYLAKRRMLLNQGLVFVEIDFLHETPPTFPPLLDYRRGGHAYRIVTLDPRPTLADGITYIAEFDVDTPIPALTFYGSRVDYSELPLRFNRYSEADQLRIVNRMLTILEAVQQGQDLEQALLPLLPAPTTLEEGLKQLESRRKT